MSKLVKLWARRKLDFFRHSLGGCCITCGDDDNDNLELDCIDPQGDTHHRMSTDQRATFYWRQLLMSNLQLLCKECHQEKSKNERLNKEQQEENEPF